MAITATSEGSTNFEPVPAGTFPARCFSMIHLGTMNENIMGTEKQLNKVRISWELPTELKVFKEENGEQPLVISKDFTLSMNEKATLRKYMESWRGKSYTEEEAKSVDITKLLGVPCLLSIIHKTSKNGKKYADISSVTTLPKGMEVPSQINPTFELNYENFDNVLFETLPDFIKDKMKKTPEYQKAINPESENLEGTDDDVPYVDDEQDGLPF